MATEKDIQRVIEMMKLRNSEIDFRRIPLEAENHLMERIRLGNYKQIHLAPFSRLSDNLGLMAGTPLEHFKYLVVSAIALFSRSAIEGGASPDDVYDLSDALMLSLSYSQTVEEVYEFYPLSAIMFAKLVHSRKEQHYSYQVERILNYISRNIYKKISLEDISSFTNLSPNYLCSIFMNQMGISIHNYIQREKINISCNLLKYSDRSVSDISAYMGFQTQSNFTTIFRKWMKISPSQYRKENYKEVF